MLLSDAARESIRQVTEALNQAPPEDPSAAKLNKERRELYRRKYEEARLRRPGERQGLNMILPAEVVGKDAAPVFGHVPGAKPGITYQDRGDLYVAGVHLTLMKGIHAPSTKAADFERGAYSIVLSGGYMDDEDMGESFWYTGEGGQDAKAKRQVKDQSMDRGANAALRNNCLSLTPVRVIRGYLHTVTPTADGNGTAGTVDTNRATSPAGISSPGGGSGSSTGKKGTKGKEEKRFVYEGLYIVLEFRQEPSKDGPLVCKFLMHGIPGHSTVHTKVEYGIFGGVSMGGRLHARRLAPADRGRSPPLPAKRPRMDKGRKARQAMLADIRQRYSSSVLLAEDISGGQESVPIPLINEVNSATLPPGFKYIREYAWAPGVYDLVRPILTFLDEEMLEFTGGNLTCGLAFNRMISMLDNGMGEGRPEGYEPHQEEQYNASGCLLITDPCGLHECSDACKSARCQKNKQLTNGVSLPLEVFMTEGKGWGVRCREHIPVGAFVCTYVGQVMTDHMADMRKGSDHYLFDLDFFTHIYQEIVEKAIEAIEEELPLHKIPPVLPFSAVRRIQRWAAERARGLKAAADQAGATAPATVTADPDAAGPSIPVSSDEPQPTTPTATTATTTTLNPALELATIKQAAEEMVYACREVAALARQAGSGSGPDPSSANSSASHQNPSGAHLHPVVAEAEAALAVCDSDPGAFFIQSIYGRDEAEAAAAAAAAAAGAVRQTLEEQDGVGGIGMGSIHALEAKMDAGEAKSEEYLTILVLDARDMGNIGRFINHSCDGNLTIQAVFAGAYRNTFLYHVGLYAVEDIPPMTELTYNYGYHNHVDRGDGSTYGMQCHCGAPNCRGQLL